MPGRTTRRPPAEGTGRALTCWTTRSEETPRSGGRTGRRTDGKMADPTGFEPAISSVTGWHVGPLHHGSSARRKDTSKLGRPMSDHLIDLRSDTVTKPSPEMRRAMAEAELGDDVFGDDPTVIALEERAAELTGKEAALFVASGTMGNLVSVMAQVPRGGEIIAGDGNHSFAHEAANYAVIVGATMKNLPWDDRGRMDPVQIRLSFRDPHDVHEPITSLVML